MRTVLMSGVAALALSFATGSMSPAHAQASAPSMSSSGDASNSQMVPTMATSATNSGSDHWAHQPGTGASGPASTQASNIDRADTRSVIAPHFPEPKVGEGASPDKLLRAAESSLAAHHTGTAQQALEMAETRLLDRSTPVNAANRPDQNSAIEQITDARRALASGNTAAVRSSIQMALNDQAAGGSSGSSGGTSGAGSSGMGSAGSSSSSGASTGTGSSSSSASSYPNGQTGQGMGAGSPPAPGNQGPIEPGMSAGSTGTNAPSSGVSGNGMVGNSTSTNGASPGSSTVK